MSYLAIKADGIDRAMPLPPKAAATASEVFGYQPFSGVYFGWRGDKVFYVGKSQNVPLRLSSHNKIRPSDVVSWIPFDSSEMHLAELFYIWLLEPSENSESGTNEKAAIIASSMLPSVIQIATIEVTGLKHDHMKGVVTVSMTIFDGPNKGEQIAMECDWPSGNARGKMLAEMIKACCGEHCQNPQPVGKFCTIQGAKLSGNKIAKASFFRSSQN